MQQSGNVFADSYGANNTSICQSFADVTTACGSELAAHHSSHLP